MRNTPGIIFSFVRHKDGWKINTKSFGRKQLGEEFFARSALFSDKMSKDGGLSNSTD